MKPILEAILSKEVLMAVFLSQVLLATSFATFITYARLYKRFYRKKVLHILELGDTIATRKQLERELRREVMSGGRIAELHRKAATITTTIYDLGNHFKEVSKEAKVRLEGILEGAAFPELILSRGERAEFLLLASDENHSSLLLNLLLKRELSRAYSLELALRALDFGIAPLVSPKSAITIRRLREGSNQHLSKRVLRFLSENARGQLQPIAKEELQDMDQQARVS